MDPKELKELLEKAIADFKAQKAENEKLEIKAASLEERLVGAEATIKKLMESGDADAAQKMAEQFDEVKNEISDLRSKMKSPALVITDEKQNEAIQCIAKKSIGLFLKKQDKQLDFSVFVAENSAEQCKALNITNPAEGGLAVAEVLARDVLDYAREFSPILSQVGRKSSMTRDFRQMIKVTYPSVGGGIENVAGTVLAETTTQTYKEVRAKEFKLYMKPRITDEAMSGTDIDVYADLVESMGEEQGIYMAAQILFGNGQNSAAGKNARGILSSNRINITDVTGESFKPTLAPDPADARDPDYFPVHPTGVSGKIGADDAAIVDFVIQSMAKLPTRYRMNAKWHMNENTKTLLELVRNTDGNPIFRADFRTGEFILNGKPVVIDDTLPDVAVDSTFAIYGDLARAYAINDGDIDKMIVDPYSVDGCTVIKVHKEMFEMAQRSDAILVMAATTNGPA